MNTLKIWLEQASSRLAASPKIQAADAKNAAQEASFILQAVLQKNAAYFYAFAEQELNTAQLEQLENLLAKRLNGEPLAYVLGTWEFWGLELEVSPATLIPRADTELLVEIALGLNLPAQARVLDMGTGTGALALALKSERPSWQVSACDVQAEAVALAKKNAQNLHLALNIFQADWWQRLEATAENSFQTSQKWDLVISNPPYIHPADAHLTQGDVRFEPSSALVGGADGLEAYRQILQGLPQNLAKNAYVLLEHGYDQAEALENLFITSPLFDSQAVESQFFENQAAETLSCKNPSHKNTYHKNTSCKNRRQLRKIQKWRDYAHNPRAILVQLA